MIVIARAWLFPAPAEPESQFVNSYNITVGRGVATARRAEAFPCGCLGPARPTITGHINVVHDLESEIPDHLDGRGLPVQPRDSRAACRLLDAARRAVDAVHA